MRRPRNLVQAEMVQIPTERKTCELQIIQNVRPARRISSGVRDASTLLPRPVRPQVPIFRARKGNGTARNRAKRDGGELAEPIVSLSPSRTGRPRPGSPHAFLPLFQWLFWEVRLLEQI